MNKMAWLQWLRRLRQSGYKQICVARGTVSWGLKDDAAGELQLWYHEMRYNDYCLFAGNTAGVPNEHFSQN